MSRWIYAALAAAFTGLLAAGTMVSADAVAGDATDAPPVPWCSGYYPGLEETYN